MSLFLLKPEFQTNSYKVYGITINLPSHDTFRPPCNSDICSLLSASSHHFSLPFLKMLKIPCRFQSLFPHFPFPFAIAFFEIQTFRRHRHGFHFLCFYGWDGEREKVVCAWKFSLRHETVSFVFLFFEQIILFRKYCCESEILETFPMKL